ncbi:putative integral membrane protein [Nitrincola lacisaponensis]|uniref:Putative integral membrane protein n=1 Tax=Nitrincola lacisaponensis TaxID=267850 RepID=A0A063Y2I9_9GAMM|nr:DUF3482 domain-containing protein [Nitrincola lacisaponensis]KDE39899.1 putative integral membrane protein [Nitrincola lacisaponensis]
MAAVAHFCVVGHPNKGKSSIVSTLTENDTVQVGAVSGTTRQADSFSFSADQQLLLTLTDTPGFQRARQVLAWLQAEAVAPHQRADRVRAFLATAEHRQRFPDEVELLTPVMQGAGIIYVTDAAGPVSASDLAEMEILRWTGQPRMAVINPMAGTAHQQEWRQTLNQYFQWVRVFDPMNAQLDSRLQLLRAMNELAEPAQQAAIERLITHLQRREPDRMKHDAQQLAAYWCEQMTRTLDEQARMLGESPEAALHRQLNQAEQTQFQLWLKQSGYQRLALETQPDWVKDFNQLMNTEHWSFWGLTSKELLIVSGAAGAAAGSLLDLGTGGASLLLGAVTGGLVGTAGGWLVSKQKPGSRLALPGVKTKRLIGPVRHPNFPFVVMARGLSFLQQLKSRTHARRDALELQVNASTWSQAEQVRLLGWARQLQSNKWNVKSQQALEAWILSQSYPDERI